MQNKPKLIQTQNPNVMLRLLPYWRKYLAKIRTELEEGELNKLVACFKPNSHYKLFVLMKDNELKGFVIAGVDTHNALNLYACAVDDVRALKEAVLELEDKIGAIGTYFATERNIEAWERLTGSKKVATILKVEG